MKTVCPSCNYNFDTDDKIGSNVFPNLTEEETNHRLALAEAFTNKKPIEWWNSEKDCWQDSDMHTFLEMLLFMKYGIVFRIKPLKK